jgi:ATP:cob(I)alamin adenosyltransferase
MGGPAMVEGGGLGVFPPEAIGPMDVQVPNGVVDIAVTDETAAVAAARQYLSYFQGSTEGWEAPDPELARRVVPENRLQVYDVRAAVDAIADVGSVLELRAAFGLGMVTALARVEGRPMGIIANNPVHLAGAIDADGADKAARFMQLCDAFDLPLLFLCDTPGIMVGPDAEQTALVRHVSRLFVTGANVTVPTGTIILRKGYGLGAQAMAGGSRERGQPLRDRRRDRPGGLPAVDQHRLRGGGGPCAAPGQEAPQHRHLVIRSPRGRREPPVGSGLVTRLWTGKGDDGTTGLLYGGRAPKSSPRLEALGAADEAQAAIGVARAEVAPGSELDDILTSACRDLWVLMAEVATGPEHRGKLVDGATRVSPEMVVAIEQVVTDVGGRFEMPSEFVVPGQDRTSALLDLARTVVRRAERAAQPVVPEDSHALPYLNRLSSLLWALARWAEGEPLPTRTARRTPTP